MKPVNAPIIPKEQGEIIFNLQGILQSFIDQKIISFSRGEWDQLTEAFHAEKEKQLYGATTSILVQKFRIQNGLGDAMDIDDATARMINAQIRKTSDPVTSPDIPVFPELTIAEVLATIPVNFPPDKKILIENLLQDKSDPEVPIPEKLKKAGLDDTHINAVNRTLIFQSFAGNFLPLIKTLQNETGVNSLKDLALNVSRKELTQKIINDQSIPEGENPEAYAEKLYTKLFQVEPTAVLRNMLRDDATTVVTEPAKRAGVTSFLANLPETFNIKTTSLYEAFNRENAFEGIAPDLRPEIIKEVQSIQRLAVLSPAPEAIPVLLKANITSGLMVSDMPKTQFVRALSKNLGTNGEAIAAQLHDNAIHARIRNEQALISLKEVEQGTGIAMVDSAMRNGSEQGKNLKAKLEENNLSWDLLFGDADYCECGECTSVYGAAAYYVDLLQYLRNNNLDPEKTGALGIHTNPADISDTPVQKLFDRRPDLKCLQLTCKNTNTILPYVDLVNEVMESYIVYNMPLPFNVSESETSAELLAEPHHTEPKAYELLQDAVFPFTLPYNQPIDAQRLQLNFLGTSRYELMDTFRSPWNRSNILEPLQKDTDPILPLSPLATDLEDLYKNFLDRAIDSEYLGLTEEDHVILTKEAFVTKEYWDQQTIVNGQVQVHSDQDYLNKIGVKPVSAYYGYASEAEMLSTEENTRLGLTFVKDQFLKRTGLLYTDLVDILGTQSVNPNLPTGNALSILERIPFSYTFLKALVHEQAPTPETKYETLIGFLLLIGASANIPDPCEPESEKVHLTELQQRQRRTDLVKWVYNYFENVGKIIVLNTGTKCIDGDLGIKAVGHDDILGTAGKIKNCQIYGNQGELIGSVNKTTGLITLEPGQPARDWSTIVLVNKQQDQIRFISLAGQYYLFILNEKPDTCSLDPVRLTHLDGSDLVSEEYDRMHRFIRLWQKLGWTVNETDKAVVGLQANSAIDIEPGLLHQLAAVRKVQEQTGLELIKLLSFWTNINTTGDNSLYKRLFLVHHLLSVDDIFKEFDGAYLMNPTEKILKHIPVLMASLNLKSEEISAIMDYEQLDALNLESVSMLYRYRLLSKLLDVPVVDFLSVLPLFPDPFENAEATLLLLQQWGQIEDSGFDYRKLNYIIQNTDDKKKPFGLARKDVLPFSKTLSDGINAIEQAHPDLAATAGTNGSDADQTENEAIATVEMIRGKASLLYDQDTVENILGILEGTQVYIVESTSEIKDLLRPLPPVPGRAQEYESLNFDNYPILRNKIHYDSVHGSFQVKGVLTKYEEEDSLFVTDDFIESKLVDKLTAPQPDPVSQYLWNHFSTPSQLIISNSDDLMEQKAVLSDELNKLVTNGSSIYGASFAAVPLSAETQTLKNTNPTGEEDLIDLNRLLLEDAYPSAIVKGERIGLRTILKNTSPSLVLNDPYTKIKTQQEKLVHDVFDGVFGPAERLLFSQPDNNNTQVDPARTNETNSSAVKRFQFLKGFLPYLRDELRQRFIVKTVSEQAALKTDITELLLTKILKKDASSVPLYSLFEDTNKAVYPNYNRWNGSFTAITDGNYTFIVKDSLTRPSVTIDGQAVHFSNTPDFPDQWQSDELQLLGGQTHAMNLYRIDPAQVLWKTSVLPATPLPSTLSYSGWDGYIIAPVNGQYSFVAAASNTTPDFLIDGVQIAFPARANPVDNWISTKQILQGGKSYKLTLNEKKLEDVSWKTETTAASPIPSSAIMTGWVGCLIPPADGLYTFIVKGSQAAPDLNIDSTALSFLQQTNSPGEWWSVPEKLQAGKVFELWLPEINLENLYWKTATSSIASIPSGSLLSVLIERNIKKAYTPVQKLALLINGFTLSIDEIKYLSEHASEYANLDFNEISLPQFLRLESYTRLRNSLPVGKINILEFFKWTHQPDNTALSQKIEDLTTWKHEQIAPFLTSIHYNLSTSSFLDETNLLILSKAMALIQKTSTTADQLFKWAFPATGFDSSRKVADDIGLVIRSRYQRDDWEVLVKPTQDKLRENQKNALISYLLVRPEIKDWGVRDADGLFEYFLIDVQMDACMETSRIKQAISSVQLFVQRCFLGLEKEHSLITPDLLDRERWDWMQRYRVWEANRKVFLYPENWIESNLRDDKSPFFKELEGELLQKDINTQNVEDALRGYLSKVDEVANLEVVGVYVDEAEKMLHVFGRTRNAPYAFYYRNLDLFTGNWLPWEKMQLDIPSYDQEDVVEINKTGQIYALNPKFKTVIANGCYLIPTVWNTRLLVFFPQFTKKTLSTDDVSTSKSLRDISEDSTRSTKAIEYWEIKMACSEYRNGRWTQKQLSNESLNDIPNEQSLTATKEFWRVYSDSASKKAKLLEAEKNKAAALAKYQAEENKLIDQLSKEFTPNADITLYGLHNPTYNNNGTQYNLVWKAENINGSPPPFSRTYQTPHPYITAFIKSQEANEAYNLVQAISNKADADLVAASLPPLPSDIAKFKFIPSILPANKVEIHVVNNDSNKIGSFIFDGSRLKTLPMNPPLYYTFMALEGFHHQQGTIMSLQGSNSSNQFQFHDASDSLFSNYTSNINAPISFHHPDVAVLMGEINAPQLTSFFKFPIEGAGHNTDKNDVFGGYDDDANSITPNSYHELKRPYSIYNWELFFHTPMMLADALSKSQQFEEAMKWYHYIFNPVADGEEKNRFWQFTPFKDMDAQNILDQIIKRLKPNEADKDINEWRKNPFKPHLVARSRPVAYMKWVVMKYVDNLVAWGDSLFRQDTIESINQATQLYVLAGHILGPRPQLIPKKGKLQPQTYLSLLGKWDPLSNAMVELELAMPYSNQTPLPIGYSNGVYGLANVFGFASTSYFCMPNNPKLTAYWDTLSDRLFKIRHCENIEGIFRKLPLFEPPIDPALLVKAAAQGISISSVINDQNTAMPNYRFYYLLQKALELCGELRSMGSALLSAIEKKESESVSLIRARHENIMLNLVLEIKKLQLDEAQKALEGLYQNRKSPEHRMRYYLQLIGEDAAKVPGLDSDFSEIANPIEAPIGESGMKLSAYEKEEMDKAGAAHDWQIQIGVVESLGSILNLIPQIKADVAPMGVGAGVTFGGVNIGNALQATARMLQVYATHLSYESSNAQRKGGFLRSLQDRVMQANSAGYEIKQIDKQIVSQQIRIALANLEISNHQKQIENGQEIEEFLKNKFSNEELYSWMKGSLSTLYHQVYNLAFDMAKKAEKVFRFERGLTSSNFIQGGYWDAGYNGLLAGEQLYVGLKQLETAYQENRGYDYEITKHISLRQLHPMAILQLRETGLCEFEIPEVVYDMDYPGQFKRRIKSVSLSVPCIMGPYTGLNGTLRLLTNKFRHMPLAKNANDYPERTDDSDDRFTGFLIPISSIATSSGQNDSGMFELNFKDERYLPFEGAGAISQWRFELPSLQQFDYHTISDVIIHVRYTSADGGARLKNYAAATVANYVKNAAELSKEEGLFSLIEMRYDMPNEWYKIKESPPVNGKSTVAMTIDDSRLPYFTKSFQNKNVESLTFIGRHKAPDSSDSSISIFSPQISLNKESNMNLYLGEAEGISFNQEFDLSLEAAELLKLEELNILVKYSLNNT